MIVFKVSGPKFSEGLRPLYFGSLDYLDLTKAQRPDSPASKRLCVITLTRIFLLTHEHQSLVREITTPSLAPFIAAALNVASLERCAASGQNSLFSVILQALNELIVFHPTSFRPFVHQIQELLFIIIAPTPSNEGLEESPPVSGLVSAFARRLFTLLHVCAPKKLAAEEWSRSLQIVIASAQRTSDGVFRGIFEDWRPRMEKSDLADLPDDETVCDRNPQPLGLPPWIGVHAGIERLQGLLALLQAFVTTTTSMAINLPISSIASLVDRILSVKQSTGVRGLPTRPQISRDERLGLEAGLPQLYVSSIEVLSSMMSRLGSGFMAISQTMLEQVLWICENESMDESIRRASYTFISQILTVYGASLPTSCTKSLCRCIKLCCDDLLPLNEQQVNGGEQSSTIGQAQPKNKSPGTNADAYLKTATDLPTPTRSADLVAAAEKVLMLTLTNLPSGYLPMAIRTLIDRTMILSNNEKAMFASVTNPQPTANGKKPSASILPMLARAHSGQSDLEALLRPQMPLVQLGNAEIEEKTFGRDEEIGRYEEDRNGLREDRPGDAFDFNYGADSRGDLTDDTKGNSNSSTGAHISTNGVSTNDDMQPGSGIFQSTPDPLKASKKRDRDPGFSGDAGIEDRLAATVRDEDPSEAQTSNKRLRVTGGDLEQGQESQNAVTDVPAAVSRRPVTPPLEIPLNGKNKKLSPLASDESDFEMPTLYLDSDSDEEDKGEEDG